MPKCPFCNKELNHESDFDSCPCHFSYSEDAPDFMSGKLYTCQNPECSDFGSFFYTLVDSPRVVRVGRPEGV